MRQLTRKIVANLRPDPDQPRKHFDPATIAELGQSLITVGQQVPIITVGDTVIDGEMRVRAALEKNLKELDSIDLDKRPTAEELLIIQAHIDLYRVHLTIMERAAALVRLQTMKKRSLGEACRIFGISQSYGSKLISLLKLAPDIQEQLNSGAIDIERAHIISQESDHAKQLALLHDAKSMSREQLRRRAHCDGGQVEVRTKSARFPLKTGVTVIVQGAQIDLGDAIESLQSVIKELRQGQRQSWDISTAQSVLRDKAAVRP